MNRTCSTHDKYDKYIQNFSRKRWEEMPGGKPNHRWSIILTRMMYDRMECIDVTKVEGCCHGCDPWVSLCVGNLLRSWTIISVSRRTLLREVCHFFTQTEERMKISIRWPYDGVQLRSDKLLVCSNMAELL